MAQAISEIILEWTKTTFPTLESIPKDADTRNNMFRQFAATNKELDAKKHLGIFYTQLQKHIEKNLNGKFSDFIKKRQAPPKQEVTGLKTNITLNPKEDSTKPKPHSELCLCRVGTQLGATFMG